MESKKGYHSLIVWQKSVLLIKQIYLLTNSFPSSEVFGLVSQIRRAIISVALNIAEDSRRNTKKDYLHFLMIADGSLSEVEACFEIAFELGFISKTQWDKVELQRREIAYMLAALIKSLNR